MKRIILLLVVLVNILAAQAQSEKKQVVATASMIADMAHNIAGDLVEVQSIVPIGGDPHLHEPTPRDARLINRADLVLKNGLTFEGWLNELIENSGTMAKVIQVTEGIEPISSKQYKNSADPHAWMDARLGLVYIKNIKNALVELAPEFAKEFEFNYEIYRRQLEEVDSAIRQEIQQIPTSRRVLITSHDAFQYYGRAYGIRLEAVLGTSTDAEAQTSDIIRLNKVIKESNIPAVFIESTVNPKLLQQLAKDNDIKIGGELYADSIGDEDSPAPTYLDMLRHNTHVIVQALTREPLSSETHTTTTETKSDSMPTLFWLLLGLMLLGGLAFIFNRK